MSDRERWLGLGSSARLSLLNEGAGEFYPSFQGGRTPQSRLSLIVDGGWGVLPVVFGRYDSPAPRRMRHRSTSARRPSRCCLCGTPHPCPSHGNLMGSPICLWVLYSHAGPEPTSSWVTPREPVEPAAHPPRGGFTHQMGGSRTGFRGGNPPPGGFTHEMRWLCGVRLPVFGSTTPTIATARPRVVVGWPDRRGTAAGRSAPVAASRAFGRADSAVGWMTAAVSNHRGCLSLPRRVS